MRPVAGSSSPRAGFVPTSGCVTSLIEQVAMGQVFLPVLRFYPVSIIPPMLHTHSFFHHRRYVTSPVGTTPLSDSKVRPKRSLLIAKMYGLLMLLPSIQYPFLDICVSLELRAHLAYRSTAHLSYRSRSGRPLITVSRKLCRAGI